MCSTAACFCEGEYAYQNVHYSQQRDSDADSSDNEQFTWKKCSETNTKAALRYGQSDSNISFNFKVINFIIALAIIQDNEKKNN